MEVLWHPQLATKLLNFFKNKEIFSEEQVQCANQNNAEQEVDIEAKSFFFFLYGLFR